MQSSNHCYSRAKILEAKFRCILRLFVLDLTSSNTTRLRGLRVRVIKALYLYLRRRLHTRIRCQPTWTGQWNSTRITSAYTGCAVNAAWEQAVKSSFSVCSDAAVRCTPKSFLTVQKRPCKISLAVKLPRRLWLTPMGLVAVGFDHYFRVRHGQNEFVYEASHINGIKSFGSLAKVRLQPFKGLPNQFYYALQIGFHLTAQKMPRVAS